MRVGQSCLSRSYEMAFFDFLFGRRRKEAQEFANRKLNELALVFDMEYDDFGTHFRALANHVASTVEEYAPQLGRFGAERAFSLGVACVKRARELKNQDLDCSEWIYACKRVFKCAVACTDQCRRRSRARGGLEAEKVRAARHIADAGWQEPEEIVRQLVAISSKGSPRAEGSATQKGMVASTRIVHVEVFLEPGGRLAALRAAGSTVAFMDGADRAIRKFVGEADSYFKFGGELVRFAEKHPLDFKWVDQMDDEGWLRFLNARGHGTNWERWYASTRDGRWNVAIWRG